MPALWIKTGHHTTLVPMYSRRKLSMMDIVGRRTAEMDRGLEHGPRYCDFFSQRTFIYRGGKKQPATMSKPNPTFRHP